MIPVLDIVRTVICFVRDRRTSNVRSPPFFIICSFLFIIRSTVIQGHTSFYFTLFLLCLTVNPTPNNILHDSLPKRLFYFFLQSSLIPSFGVNLLCIHVSRTPPLLHPCTTPVKSLSFLWFRRPRVLLSPLTIYYYGTSLDPCLVHHGILNNITKTYKDTYSILR